MRTTQDTGEGREPYQPPANDVNPKHCPSGWLRAELSLIGAGGLARPENSWPFIGRGAGVQATS